MPVEYALITQFLAIIFQYFSDARATVRGWCPPWYNTYRFVLTFFAGASIVLSLIGRGQISTSDINSDAKTKRLVGYADHDHDAQWKALERKELEKRRVETAAQDEGRGEEIEEGQGEQENGGTSDERKDNNVQVTKGSDDKKQKK